MASQKVLDRVKKLLALAGSNPSQEEAQAAMLMAQRMIAEHQIDETVLAAEVEAEAAEQVDVEVLGKRDRYYEALACIVARNFRCEIYFTQGRAQGKLVTILRFIGMESDVAAAKLVYEMAKNSMLSNRAEYLKQRQADHYKEAVKRNDSYSKCGIGRIFDTKMDAKAVRDIRVQWTNGFVKGMSAAFTAQVNENNWTMMLQLPGLVVQKAKEIGLKKTASNFSTQTVRAIDESARANGKAAGEAFAQVSRSGNKGPASTTKMLGA